jgi:hypothetical protein
MLMINLINCYEGVDLILMGCLIFFALKVISGRSYIDVLLVSIIGLYLSIIDG